MTLVINALERFPVPHASDEVSSNSWKRFLTWTWIVLKVPPDFCLRLPEARKPPQGKAPVSPAGELLRRRGRPGGGGRDPLQAASVGSPSLAPLATGCLRRKGKGSRPTEAPPTSSTRTHCCCCCRRCRLLCRRPRPPLTDRTLMRSGVSSTHAILVRASASRSAPRKTRCHDRYYRRRQTRPHRREGGGGGEGSEGGSVPGQARIG